jgi:hypothetical protein
MPGFFRRTDASAIAGATPDPAINAAPTPKREEKRWFSLGDGERAKQFALRLKANARWMKQFLHGGR